MGSERRSHNGEDIRATPLLLFGCLFNLDDVKTWWQGLLQLIRLLWVIKSQSVEITRAADFELRLDFAVLYPRSNLLYACLRCILSGGNLQELLDVANFFRHGGECLEEDARSYSNISGSGFGRLLKTVQFRKLPGQIRYLAPWPHRDPSNENEHLNDKDTEHYKENNVRLDCTEVNAKQMSESMS